MATPAPAVETIPEVHASPAETPVGDVYEAALAKDRGEEPKKPVKPAKAPEAKVDDKTTPGATKEPTAPASALEAALETRPAEAKPEVQADPLAEFDEKKPNWARAREVMKKQSEEAKALRDQLATAAKPDPEASKETESLKAELARIAKENAEYKDAMVALNIELEPTFRREFIDGRKELVGKAAAKLNAYGGKASDIEDALTLPEGRRRDEAIKEAMGDLDDVARNKILVIVTQIEDLDERRASVQKDPQQTWEQLEQKRAEEGRKAQEQHEAQKQEVFESTKKLLPAILRHVDPSLPDAEKWNSGITAAYERAQQMISPGADMKEVFVTAFKGSDYDRVTGLLTESRTELKTARAQLSEYEASEPDVKGRGKPKGVDPIDRDPGEVYEEAKAAAENN